MAESTWGIKADLFWSRQSIIIGTRRGIWNSFGPIPCIQE